MIGAEEGTPSLPPDAIELLHCLGYIYLRHGQSRRAIVLFLVAAQHGGNPQILTALALALVESGLGEPALQVLDRLDGMAPEWGSQRLIGVIRARAMLCMGEADQARALFAKASGAAPA